MTRRVVKVGGSLLNLPDLQRRLREWIADQPPADTLLLAGGGKLADAVRELDRLHRLGERQAHWLCIRCMTITARALVAMAPNAVWLDDWRDILSSPASPQLYLADPWALLQPRHVAAELPESWAVTSDSIAAWLALRFGAVELALLKSCPAPADTLPQLAADGYVDPHFPRVASKLPLVRLVDLRGSPVIETRVAQQSGLG